MNDVMESVELRSHKDYISLLNHIKPIASYVELVQIDDDEKDPVIVYALKHLTLIHKCKTKEWSGTIRRGAGITKYTFEINADFWNYLKKFSSFFFSQTTPEGYDEVEYTEFGLSDIAFLDSEHNTLFYTTTHKGYACIRKEL